MLGFTDVSGAFSASGVGLTGLKGFERFKA